MVYLFSQIGNLGCELEGAITGKKRNRSNPFNNDCSLSMAINSGHQVIPLETTAGSAGSVLETHVKSVRPAFFGADNIVCFANNNCLKMNGRSICSPAVADMPGGCSVRSRYRL